jgi:glycosyltransferase involved in cell wall biosynthesis
MNVALVGSLNDAETGPSRVTEGLYRGLTENGLDVDVYYSGDRNPDDEHLHRFLGSDASVLDRLCAASELDTDEYDVVHPLEAWPRSTAIRTVQWTSGVWERRQRAPREYPGTRALAGDLVMNLAGRTGATRTGTVVATSPETVRQLRTHWRLEPDDIIPLGIESASLSQPDGVTGQVLLPGRINQKKGQVSVCRHLDDEIPLTVVGSVDDEAYWNRVSHESEGWVERERLEQYYAESDIVLVPSVHENFSMVALEAMAYGCCVVIRDTCGIAQFPWSGPESGMVVGSTGKEMATEVEALLETPDRLRRLKRRAHERAQQLTWPRVAAEYADLYDTL